MGGHNAPIVRPATIANGTALSPAVDLSGYVLAAIQMPAAWTAATITLQASEKIDGTFIEVSVLDYVNTAAVVVQFNVAANIFYVIGGTSITNPLLWLTLAGLRYVKVRSGTVGTPVNQAAERVVRLWCKDLA